MHIVQQHSCFPVAGMLTVPDASEEEGNMRQLLGREHIDLQRIVSTVGAPSRSEVNNYVVPNLQ